MKISFPYDTVFDFWNDSEVSVDFESLNNNTLEFIQLQCKNILTKRKLNDPPEGTHVLKEIMEDAHTMGLDPDDPSIEPQYREQYKAYRERITNEREGNQKAGS